MSHTMPATGAETESAAGPRIEIYNTLTRRKEPFQPVVEGRVGIYLCGPTVYDKAHIGHMVGPVIFDTIKRYLEYCGFEVTWVVNITDVDDKLIFRSRDRGVSMAELAREMTADYLENLKALGVDQIDEMPCATDHIPTIISFIEQLIDRGFAYEVEGDVFFDVTRDTEYGKLTNRTLQSIQGEGGEAAERKRHPADFALWKKAKEGEPSWESPWGPGRPGWHIECSAMSHAILGETFDIHGGGLDLVFPHHENEIAQSECCHGKPMAKYWLHNGLLKREAAGKVGGRAERNDSSELSLEEIAAATAAKESRSKGAGGLSDLIDQFGGETIRFFLLRTHYRSTVLFTDQGLEETKVALDAFYRFFERYERVTGRSFYDLPAISQREEGEFDPGEDELLREVHRLREEFLAKMDDDFNTGAAISQLFELVRTLNRAIDQHRLEAPHADAKKLEALSRGVATLRELSALLGVFREPPQVIAESGDSELTGKLIELLIEVRAEARQRKDFQTADQIRDRLAEIGVTLEDRPDGTGWRIETA